MNATISPRLTERPAWRALARHHQTQSFDLAAMFAQDAQRAGRLTARCGDVLLDYSKNLLNAETMRLLMRLARECDLRPAIDCLFAGGIVNPSENRPALHTALRARSPVQYGGRDISVDVRRELERMRAYVASLHGSGGVTDVIHIGIGGARLGAAFAGDALRAYAEKPLRVHYLSTVDGGAVRQLLPQLNARATRVIVASKTFNTVETFANARAVRGWLASELGSDEAARAQMAAITARPAKAIEFGIARENIFEVWDWVGGRYSLCSAMSLPLALTIGMAQFDALRAGAHAMDEHFRTAEFEQNLPVILALLDVWYGNFHGTSSRVVLPYLSGFKRFPAFLQQLEMESLGKRVRRDGTPVDVSTGLIVWGESGTSGQHAFHQLLHQGTRLIPAEFIIACRARHGYAEHQQILLANALAQAEALMSGHAAVEPHRAHPGNRPSTMIVLPEADPFHLGMLVALYEQKVYVDSVIWDINAFDQWGVEFGKQIAARLQARLTSPGESNGHDASTTALINHIRKHAGRPL